MPTLRAQIATPEPFRALRQEDARGGGLADFLPQPIIRGLRKLDRRKIDIHPGSVSQGLFLPIAR
jgi:hypothetical protein